MSCATAATVGPRVVRREKMLAGTLRMRLRSVLENMIGIGSRTGESVDGGIFVILGFASSRFSLENALRLEGELCGKWMYGSSRIVFGLDPWHSRLESGFIGCDRILDSACFLAAPEAQVTVTRSL